MDDVEFHLGTDPLVLNLSGVHEDLPTLIEILRDRGWFTAVTHKTHVQPIRKFPYHKGYPNGAIEVVDSIFSAVTNGLHATGALTNTLVVYTGDHGIGLHRAKQSVYSAGLPAPLLIDGPGVVGARRIAEPVTHLDLAMTMIDFAGLTPMPAMHGITDDHNTSPTELLRRTERFTPLAPALGSGADNFNGKTGPLNADTH